METNTAKLSPLENAIKDEIANFNIKTINHFEFIKDEFQIRIESLKSKLDEISKTFDEKVNEEKKKFKEHVMEILNLGKIQENLTTLNACENGDEFDKLCENLNATLKTCRVNVKYIENEQFQITEQSIGSVLCCYDSEEIFNDLEIERISLNYIPEEVVKLDEDKYLIKKRFNFDTVITDAAFKRIDDLQIDRDEWGGYMNCNLCFITRGHMNFYAIDRTRFISFDAEQKLVAKFEFFPSMDMRNRFTRMFCDQNDILYLLQDNLVLVYSSEFIFIEQFQFECNTIYDVNVINDVMCISCRVGTFFKLRFFKISEKRKISEYDIGESALTVYKNKWFIAYDSQNLYSFNEKGILISIKEFAVGDATGLTSFDNYLFISPRNEMQVVKITLKSSS